VGSTIFETKDSIFFVGGITSKVGDQYAGGCTLEAWNDPAKLNKNLANVMEADGTPVSVDAAWGGSGIACDVETSGGGKVLIKKTGSGWFAYVKEGLVANVVFEDTYTSGRYRVTGNEMSVDKFEIDLNWIANTRCDVKVGGAFDKAQNAWNSTDAAQGYNVIIYSNKSQSKTNGDFTATWNLGTAGGSLTNKSFKRFVGFTTQPEGGGQITFDGEDNAAFVSGGAGIFFNTAIESVIFENVIVEDAYINWRTSSQAYHVRFGNCEGNSGSYAGWVLGYGRGFSLISCKAKDNEGVGFAISYSSGYPNQCLINCIASGNTKEGFYRLGGHSGSIAIGCVAYNNGNGGTKYSGFLVRSNYGFGAVINCVSYNNGKHGFEFLYRNPVAINCIAQSNGQKGFYADTAAAELMAPHVAYCNSYDNGGGNYDLPDALPPVNCIEKDSLFVDAASGDFRPRSPAVLRGGRPDINGNPTQMGAILQKYQFGDRERIANMARLRIIR